MTHTTRRARTVNQADAIIARLNRQEPFIESGLAFLKAHPNATLEDLTNFSKAFADKDGTDWTRNREVLLRLRAELYKLSLRQQAQYLKNDEDGEDLESARIG
jgi:hypothetical protein